MPRKPRWKRPSRIVPYIRVFRGMQVGAGTSSPVNAIPVRRAELVRHAARRDTET